MRTENRFSLLWETARTNYGNRVMVISAEDDSQFHFADVDTLVNSTRQLFAQRGLVPGDRIIICGDNHLEYLLIIWAALLSGLVIVPIDRTIGEQRLNHIYSSVRPSLLFLDRQRSLPPPSQGKIILFDSSHSHETPAHPFFSSCIKSATEQAQLKITPYIGREEQPATILFTSGSSGTPKGVVLSRGALCNSGQLMADSYNWNGSDTLICLGEMHTMSGFRNPAIAAVCSATTVLIAPASLRSHAPAVAEICHRYSVSLVTAVPAFLHDLLSNRKRWLPEMLDTVQKILVTGFGIDQKTITLLRPFTKPKILNYYGLTETAGLCCKVPEEYEQQGDGCIGIPLGAEIRIVDEIGRDVEDGQTGELLVRSSQLMFGYWNAPGQTKKVIRNNWFHTGDLVSRKPDGMLFLLGRKDDQIKTRAGESIHPEDLRRCLNKHPVVRAAAITGIKSDSGYWTLHAFFAPTDISVDPKETESVLRQWLRTQLGPTAVPHTMHLCRSLPITANGKIDREKLNQLYLNA